MNWTETTVLFDKKIKKLLKKFPVLKRDLQEFNDELINNPETGTLITNYRENKVFKVRLSGKSKGKGKSGGFRVITYLVKETDIGTEINLITIYDKSEESSISKTAIIKLLKQLF